MIKEFWLFIKERKKWWLLPLIIMILLVAIIITLGYVAGPLSPFIYALF